VPPWHPGRGAPLPYNPPPPASAARLTALKGLITFFFLSSGQALIAGAFARKTHNNVASDSNGIQSDASVVASQRSALRATVKIHQLAIACL